MIESMDEKHGRNLEVIECSRDRVKEVFSDSAVSYQTNPIVQKLLDFSKSDKTRKFSVHDLFKR